MVAFAEALERPKATFASMFDGAGEGDYGTIRLLSYPGEAALSAEEAAAASVGISAHTDFEAFTLMHQDAPGLQLLKRQGDGHAREWTDAPVLPGAFLVIVGDVLERMTNGEWRATPHRVARTAHARNALIRFNAVSATTLLQPLPKFVTAARPPRYSAVTMRTHMETTMQNLADGRGAWDSAKHKSLTATYLYIGGEDHRKVRSGEKKVGGSVESALGVRHVLRLPFRRRHRSPASAAPSPPSSGRAAGLRAASTRCMAGSEAREVVEGGALGRGVAEERIDEELCDCEIHAEAQQRPRAQCRRGLPRVSWAADTRTARRYQPTPRHPRITRRPPATSSSTATSRRMAARRSATC